MGAGEGVVSAWFASRIKVATITVPFVQKVPGRSVRAFAAAEFHRRIGAGQTAAAEPSALRPGNRRRILAPGDDRHDRRAADRRRNAEVSRRQFAQQARSTDRCALGPAGVRRSLGVQMVRPVAGQQREAARPGDVVVLPLDSHASRPEHAVGQIRAQHRHRLGQHARKRRDEFLRPASRSARAVRNHIASVSRHVDHLRPLPQPSAGKMDQRPILRDGQSV